MLSIRTAAISRYGVIMLAALGAGCGPNYNVNPNVTIVKTSKRTNPVPCDTKINADINTGGVDLDAAYICEKDTVTWQIANGHTFHIKFSNGTPFQGNKTDFSDQDPSGKVKEKYNKLEIYKYTITVDQLNPVDPQVVGGGNP